MVKHTNGKIKNDKRIFLLLGLILILTYQSIQYTKASISIKKAHKVVCGKIIKTLYGRSGSQILLQFSYLDKVIDASISNRDSIAENYKRGIENILIVFNYNNVKQMDVLVSSEDLVRYNIDSKDTINLNFR